MGVLRDNAGLIGGIGQAISTLGANKREERLMALQHERETALRKMEQDFRAGEANKQRTFESDENSKERQVKVGEQMRADDRHNATLKSNESEGSKDRESREKIAKIEAGSRERAAGQRGTKSKRWTINKVKSTNTERGKIEEREDIVLTDHTNARTFKQKGDKFIPQGGEPTGAVPNQQRVQHLLQNPDTADQFLQKYGYLPAGFFDAVTAGTESDTTEEE